MFLRRILNNITTTFILVLSLFFMVVTQFAQFQNINLVYLPQKMKRFHVPGIPFSQPKIPREPEAFYVDSKDLMKKTYPLNRLPDMIMIGAKKCGTGAFQNFIKNHYKVKMANSEEIHFFDNSYNQDVNWYMQKFPNTYKDYNISLIEKSPNYFPTVETPERIFDTFSQVCGEKYCHNKLKIILVLCNPSLRAYSDYVHTLGLPKWAASKELKEQILEYGTFEEYAEAAFRKSVVNPQFNFNFDDPVFYPITKGIYLPQLKNWLKYFNKNQFVIVDGDKLLTNPGPEMVKAQKLLDLNVEITEKNFVINESTGHYCFNLNPKGNGRNQCLGAAKGRTKSSDGSSKVSEKARKVLDKIFHKYNLELLNFLGSQESEMINKWM